MSESSSLRQQQHDDTNGDNDNKNMSYIFSKVKSHYQDQNKSIITDLEEIKEKNQNVGFKSGGNRKFHRVFDRKKKKSDAIDQFGDNYFATNKEDYTISLCITLPESMIKLIDECRADVSRSRFIRKLVQYSLNLEHYSE